MRQWVCARDTPVQSCPPKDGQSQATVSQRCAAVASGHPLSTAAAVEILKAGGNAFDAVVASLAASFSAEPVLCSPGGGGFLLAHPAQGAPRVLDFFCQTPGRSAPGAGATLDFVPLHVDFGPATQEFHVGRAGAAVPGMIPGLCRLATDLGRLPLAESLQPAIRLAREGVQVTPMQEHIMGVVRPILCHTAAARAHFNGTANTRGEPPAAAGTLMRSTELAQMLEALATEGEALFTHGEVANAISSLCAEGGLLRAADLSAYQVHWREPLLRTAFGARIYGVPAPSAGGALVLFGLQLASAAAHGGLDIEPSRTPPEHRATNRPWPTPQDLARIMALSGEARAQAGLDDTVDAAAVERLLHAHKRGGTTHVSVIDAEGNAAACTVSNGEGCGYMVPGAGFMLNNMLGEEDLNPKGFFRWQPNSRVTSMMAPTIAKRADGRLLALGSGGSNRIRSALLQVLSHALSGALPLQAAIDAARLHVEQDFLHIEAGLEAHNVAALKAQWPAHQCWPQRSMFFGGVHAVERSGDGRLQAAADPRRDGSSSVLALG